MSGLSATHLPTVIPILIGVVCLAAALAGPDTSSGPWQKTIRLRRGLLVVIGVIFIAGGILGVPLLAGFVPPLIVGVAIVLVVYSYLASNDSDAM